MKSLNEYVVESLNNNIKHYENGIVGEFSIGKNILTYTTKNQIIDNDEQDEIEKFERSQGTKIIDDRMNGRFCPDDVDDTLYVHVLKVDKSERGKGIATKLIKALIEYAESINYNIYLQASALDYNDGLDQDQLVKFYKKLGFVRGGCKDETWLIYVVNDNY